MARRHDKKIPLPGLWGAGNGDAEIGCYMVSIVDEPHLFTQGRSTGEFALLCVFWGVSA